MDVMLLISLQLWNKMTILKNNYTFIRQRKQNIRQKIQENSKKLDGKYSDRVQLPANLATLATPTKFLELQFKFRVSKLGTRTTSFQLRYDSVSHVWSFEEV